MLAQASSSPMPSHEEIHVTNMDDHEEGHDGMGGCEEPNGSNLMW